MPSRFSTKWINVSEPIPHVVHVELDRKPVNAFNKDFWKQYQTVFDRIGEEGPDLDIRVVVLSSALPKIFTAGIDFSDAQFWTPPNPIDPNPNPTDPNPNPTNPDPNPDPTPDPARTAHHLRRQISAFQHAISSPERCPVPVIVALHGAVVGLGMDMIGSCDVRIASGDAVFCIKEIDLSLSPDIGTLAYLPHITSNQSLLRELTYTARPFSASVALNQLGLVSRVVEGGRRGGEVVEGGEGGRREVVEGGEGGRRAVIQEALALARVVAEKSPVAVGAAKAILGHSRDHSVQENLEYTATWNAAALQTYDGAAALSAIQSGIASKSKVKPTFARLGIKKDGGDAKAKL